MPYTLNDGDVIRLSFFCNDGVQQAINVNYFRQTAHVGTGVTDQAIADAFAPIVAPLYKALMATRWVYAGIKAQVFKPALQVAVTSTLNIGAGTVAGNDAPPQCAGLITKKTAVPGRPGRGRMYVGGVCTADILAPGTPSAGYVTRLTNLANGIFALTVVGGGANTATLQPCLWSKKLATTVDIRSLVIRGSFATQRRRSLVGKPDVLGP
jgi:hypothetical protein